MTSTVMTPLTRSLITIAVMVATLLQALDVTIVNVALPHMQGTLGATPDSISWVLTSYLVASAILMPLTGYFTDILGRKKYLLIAIGGFILSSGLCGAAVSLNQIVLFRLLQGAFGAALVPLSQAILVDIYPENERGKAMAIWGIGVMVGPALGPTLGGYLTDVASWRWNFYINLPIGVMCWLLTWQVLPETKKIQRQMDWFGLGLISTAIASLQFCLDRGNQNNWFESSVIQFSALLAVLSFLGFLLHNVDRKSKAIVFDLTIFSDRNFTISSLLMAMIGIGLLGVVVMIPIMLESLFDYPVLTTGLVMAPRGLSAMIGMLLVGKLTKLVDPRILIAVGILITAFGIYLGSWYNLDISYEWIIWPMIVQGFGLGMIFVALSATAYSTLSPHLRAEAAGIFSLLRTIGSSVGISIVATSYTRYSQMAWNQIGGFIHPYNFSVHQYVQSMNLSLDDPLAIKILQLTLIKQAQIVSFVNVFGFIAVSILLMLPLVFLLRKPKQTSENVVAHMD